MTRSSRGTRLSKSAPTHQDYRAPFAFTGKIDKLTISLAPPVLSEDDIKKLKEAERAAQDAN